MKDTEDVRKKEKKINREHWMCRIQMYTFGIDAPTFYMGYCPFFWMTWVCVLMSPFALLWNVVLKPVCSYGERLSSVAREKRESSLQALYETPLQPSHFQLLDLSTYYRNEKVDAYFTSEVRNAIGHNASWINIKRITVWLNVNPDWRTTFLPDAKAWLEEQIKKEEASRERAKNLRKIGNVASVCGSTVFKGIIPAVILVAAYYIYRLLSYVVTNISLQDFVLALTLLFSAAAFVIAVPIIIDLIKVISGSLRRRKSVTIEEKDSWYVGMLNAIGNAFTFVKDTVRMTYKQECPLIIWGDETGSITRRDKSNEKEMQL